MRILRLLGMLFSLYLPKGYKPFVLHVNETKNLHNEMHGITSLWYASEKL